MYLFWWMDIGSYVKPYIPFTGTYIGYHCGKCGGNFIARESDTVPITCKECGQKEALYGYFCTKCNLGFGASSRNPDQLPKCPRCRRGAFVTEITADIVAKAKAPPEKKKLEGE